MIDRMKGGIEPQDVRERWTGSIELLKEDQIMNPKNKPVVYYHRQKHQRKTTLFLSKLIRREFLFILELFYINK